MTRTLAAFVALATLTCPLHADTDDANRNGATGPDRVVWEHPAALSSNGTPQSLWLGGLQTFLSLDQDPEGDMPRQLAYTPDGETILIVHRDTDNITAIDVDTRVHLDTVAVGDFPVDIAVTPDGMRAVVPNVFSNDVSIINLQTMSVESTVPVTGEQPFAVRITPDGTTAVVAVITDGTNSRFSVINIASGTETDSFVSTPQGSIGFFFNPEAGISGNIFTSFELTPDGLKIVLPDRGNDQYTIYNLDGTEFAQHSTADQPAAVDVSVDGTTAVISHEGTAKTITKIDLATGGIDDTFTTADNLTAQRIRITPDGTHAIAAISNNVIFVNLTTGSTVATINTGSVGDIEFTHDGVYAFVSNFNARVINVASRTLVDTIPFAACVDAATSPTERRAIALNNRFGENVHFYDIDGSGGFLEGAVGSGPPDEGDGTFAGDISADGSVAVACNVVSGNVCIIELATNTIRSYVDVGFRPKEVRITPDGTHAVVCAMDANTVVIIDLSNDTVVSELFISTRPGRVRISPDSQWAYVLNVAGSDRISFIELDGANSSIVSQVSAGQTGAANGYTFTEVSGIELSDDGSILAVCDSFNDFLRLYDTASRTQIAAVPVGDFPIRAAFNHAGDRVYVANAFGDSFSIVQNNGGTWSTIDTIPNIDFPLTVEVDAQDRYVYLGNSGSNAGIRVYDAQTDSIVTTVIFADGSPRDSALSSTDNILYIASTNAELVRLNALGPFTGILDTTPLMSGPSDLAYNDVEKIAMFTEPIPDGVDIIDFGDDIPGDINGDGSVDVDDLLLLLAAWGSNDADADLDGSGTVDVDDLLILLANWT